jgi:hypothetical protein
MPSWQTPTPEQVARARAQLTQPQHYRYFFDQLANPRWLMPLREQGFFARPPAPVIDPDGGITFPSWPASRYLARMAAMDEESAQAALEIALEIPETENTRVHEDLVDAALAMPPELAARLVPKARHWARLPYQLLLPEKLGALVSLLARGGQAGSALNLARTLLAVRAEERAPVELAGGERFEFPPEARPHIDLWHYQQIVERNIPDLVEAVGEHALEVLCDVLNAAVRLSRYGPDDTGPGDRSHVWRRSIAGHDDLAGHDVEDVLVTAIRDAAERLVAGEAARVSALVALLEGYPWRIFHRLALHLLRLFPSNAAGLIAERLVDRERFEDPDLWHEYTLLARERFADLAPAQRETILSWIESGPDLAEVAAVWEWREHGPDVPAEAEFGVAYRRHWQLRHLARLRDALPTPWRERHDALARELGDREQEEFPDYRSGVRSGPISPVTADELRAMGVDELLAYLRDWQPGSPYPLDPSREGLGGELTRVVAEDPVSFAAVGNRFRDLDPAYVGALLAGLREAVRRGTPIDWAPVLELCRWVIGRMAEPPPPEDGEDDPEPADRPLRGTVADLLEAGLAVGGQGAVPFALRGELWAVLEPLTDDPEPPYEGDEPSDRSINTTRGKAMHAVVRYALWARRSLDVSAEMQVDSVPK